MSEKLLTEVPEIDASKEILVEKHIYSDKVSVSPCQSDDKECHQRWIQAFSDCT
jgi:hypothetical protein